jgi:hypothetical protein
MPLPEIKANAGDLFKRQIIDALEYLDGLASGPFDIADVTGLQAELDAKAEALDDLSDVVLTSPANEDSLRYNGSNWVNAASAAFSAHKGSTDQTGILTNTVTKVTFTTESFDVGSYYDAATSTWTPPAGKYQITASINFTAGVVDGAIYGLYIYRNGVIYREASVRASGANTAAINISALVNASGTDYYEVYCIGLGAGNKTVSGTFVANWFEGFAI